MAWFDKLIFWKNKEVSSGVFKKIVSIRGEVNPGFLSVDCGVFDENGPTPDPGFNIQLPITKELRPTINRILCGQDTQDDRDILKSYVDLFI